MNRFLLPVGLFGLLVLLLAVGLQRAPNKSVIQSALLGKAAPAFTLPVLGSPSGERFDSRSWRGRWYLINVWGTWCAECRVEHAALLAIKASGKAPILGMDWKDQPDEALAWLRELGNPYDIVVEDRDGKVAIDYGVYGAPETFLVDPQGVVVYRHVGALTMQVWEQELSARINAGNPAVQP